MTNDSILADFDQEVKSRCELIRVNAENVSANLQSALDLTLLAIPELVRKMPVKELMEKYDGDIQKAAAHCAAPKTQPSPKKRQQSPGVSVNKKTQRKETPPQQKQNATRPKSSKQIKSPLHMTPGHTTTNTTIKSTAQTSNNNLRNTKKKTVGKSPKMPKKPV